MNRLSNAMPIVATALGRKFGVQVAVGGEEAETDGQVIRIPDLPDESKLREVAWGYLAHEAAHIRYTDFEAWDDATKESPLIEAIANRIEDIRIEAAIRRPYPGTADTLQATIDWLIHQGKFTDLSPQDHPAKVLTTYLLRALRYEVLGQQVLAAKTRSAEKVLREIFAPELVRKLRGLMTEVRRLRDTAGSVALAGKIRQLLEEQEQEQEPEPQPEEGEGEQGSGSGEQERQPDAGESEGEDTDADPSDTAPVGADSAQDDAGGQAAQSQQGYADQQDRDGAERSPSGVSDAADGPDPQQALAAVQAALGAGEGDMDADLFDTVGQLLGSGHGPSTKMLLPVAEDYAGDRQVGQVLRAKVRAESRKLSTRLHGLVQASCMVRERTVRHGRKLATKRLHRAAVGDDRIFRRQARRIAVNTALHLLIDLSGSMSAQVDNQEAFDGSQDTRRYHRALEASMALALAFDAIHGVSTAVTAFPGITEREDRVMRLVDHGSQSRLCASAFVQEPRGSTPMAQAMWYAAADLALRRESRRVMMVLSDGDPNDADAVQDLLRLCRDAQIEVIGVGIAIDVSHLFPIAIQVDDIADLKRVLFGIAERLLAVQRH